MCKGMPYVDLHDHKEGLVMIETAEKNFEGFTKREIEKAILARKVQSRIGHPPDGRFKEIVSLSENGLKNCPIDVSNIDVSNAIFGPNRAGLKGRTTRKKPVRTREQRVSIPLDFYHLHKKLTITADVMFVSGLPFLVTFTRKLKLRTAEFVPNWTAKILAKSLKKVIALYAKGGL